MDKKVPMRRCVACMQSKPKAELLRFVTLQAEGGQNCVHDKDCTVQARGFYVCPCEQCIAKAIKKKKLPKDFNINLQEVTNAKRK